MRQQIVFLDRSTLKANIRQPDFLHDWEEYSSTHPNEIVARLRNASIVITNKVPLRADTLSQLPNLKLIAVAATGYDVIDVAYCTANGIAVTNIRNYAMHSVPEHTFSLILALRRNLFAYHKDVLNGRWQIANQFCFFDHPIRDLSGAMLGIIGNGVLGKATAVIARAFGMKVFFADHESANSIDANFVPLEVLLKESDIVSLHTPLTLKTRNMISAAQLQMMKPTALLINTARGGLVDEHALADALRQGIIAGAGFDVLTTEPPKEGNPLLELNLPNFILTPHVAWASEGAMQCLADQLIDNMEKFVAGTPQHLVT